MGTRFAHLALLCVTAACVEAPNDVRERRLALDREFQEIDTRLSELEARFFWTRERVTFWEELASRHRQVTEYGCRVNLSHLEQIFEHVQREQGRQRPGRGDREIALDTATDGTRRSIAARAGRVVAMSNNRN